VDRIVMDLKTGSFWGQGNAGDGRGDPSVVTVQVFIQFAAAGNRKGLQIGGPCLVIAGACITTR